MRAVPRSVRLFVIGGVVLFAAFVGALVGGPYFAEAGRPPTRTGASVAACKQDTDCVLVPEDCCGCNQGGKQRSIAKVKSEAYERTRRKRCEGTLCTEMMSQDPSCSSKPVCSHGQCALGSGATAP